MRRWIPTLEEELRKSNGDYLTAYIRASFKTDSEPDNISYALFAAIANDPSLIQPLRLHFQKMQTEITAAARTPEIGTIIRLSLDGLWLSDLFDFAPPNIALRENLLNALLDLAHRE